MKHQMNLSIGGQIQFICNRANMLHNLERPKIPGSQLMQRGVIQQILLEGMQFEENHISHIKLMLGSMLISLVGHLC